MRYARKKIILESVYIKYKHNYVKECLI